MAGRFLFSAGGVVVASVWGSRLGHDVLRLRGWTGGELSRFGGRGMSRVLARRSMSRSSIA